MAKKSDEVGDDPVIVAAYMRLVNQTLAEPIIEFNIMIPLSFMTPMGAVITLPPGAEVYISPAQVSPGLGRSVQEAINEATEEENLRWLRMPEEQVDAERQKYTPF